MLEQEKKEKNLKLWRIAVTVLMLLPMAEMLFVLPGLLYLFDGLVIRGQRIGLRKKHGEVSE